MKTLAATPKIGIKVIIDFIDCMVSCDCTSLASKPMYERTNVKIEAANAIELFGQKS